MSLLKIHYLKRSKVNLPWYRLRDVSSWKHLRGLCSGHRDASQQRPQHPTKQTTSIMSLRRLKLATNHLQNIPGDCLLHTHFLYNAKHKKTLQNLVSFTFTLLSGMEYIHLINNKVTLKKNSPICFLGQKSINTTKNSHFNGTFFQIKARLFKAFWNLRIKYDTI